MFSQRGKGVKITDQRVRLTTEVLQGIRLLKYYTWETFYTGQIGGLRAREIGTIKKVAMARSGLIASMMFSPILASILSFVSYFVIFNQFGFTVRRTDPLGYRLPMR